MLLLELVRGQVLQAAVRTQGVVVATPGLDDDLGFGPGAKPLARAALNHYQRKLASDARGKRLRRGRRFSILLMLCSWVQRRIVPLCRALRRYRGARADRGEVFARHPQVNAQALQVGIEPGRDLLTPTEN